MILIVDDEIFALDMLVRKLSGSVLEYETCSSVSEAKQIISTQPNIKIVVTDLHMSGETGYDLLDWLTALYPKIKRVVMSAHTHEDIFTEHPNLQVDGRLKKPVDVKTELIPLLIELMKED